MKPLIIVGSGGHAKNVAEAAIATGAFELCGFLDSNPDRVGHRLIGREVLANLEDLGSIRDRYAPQFVIAIGNNSVRQSLFERFADSGFAPATVIHPSAIVSPSTGLGSGTVVLQGVVVGSEATIGQNVILGTGCVIDHDCTIGDHSHVAAGATIGGGCRLRALCWVHVGERRWPPGG